ncbi:unnamed protein product [Prorocentrum cordatum]|uniref:Calmodulin n=1 Tax=Prorocentrum cordatum TaxID=2364126 RepID=A0ABN9SRI0_9DINO|nr:unnamed protein product [Polarella glacialis]
MPASRAYFERAVQGGFSTQLQMLDQGPLGLARQNVATRKRLGRAAPAPALAPARTASSAPLQSSSRRLLPLSASSGGAGAEVFSRFDEDCNDSISVHELGAMLRYMGFAVTIADLHLLIAQVDVDRSGDLDFREFIRLMRLHRRTELNRLRSIFARHEGGDAPSGRLAASVLPDALTAAIGFGLPPVLIQALPLILGQAQEKRATLKELAACSPQENPTPRSPRGPLSSAAALPELSDSRNSLMAALQKKVITAPEVPIADINKLGRGEVVKVIGDVSKVKEACESAGLTDKNNVARGAATGSFLHVVDKDVIAGTVRCHSSLHGDLWFALPALCETRASREIADAFAGSLPALQSCGNQGVDFDSFVELADLFRVVRNVWDRMKAGFSDMEIKRFRDVFARYDSDGSGDIDEKEIMALLGHIGIEIKTKANQQAISESLEKARKLAAEAGVQSAAGQNVHSFWEFVQLMRIERTKRDRKYEDMVEETSSNLNFDPAEVAQFREIFILGGGSTGRGSRAGGIGASRRSRTEPTGARSRTSSATAWNRISPRSP